MQVILRVVGGKNNGREIKISVPEFIIGRGETAHLRPSSDLVSREHCAIRVADGKVTVTDLESRNGTFVNGKALKGTHAVRSGDSLRVGRLQFELIVDPAKAGAKKAKVNNVVEAAARTASSTGGKAGNLEDSISDWLTDLPDDNVTANLPDPADLPGSEETLSSETIQMKIEETQTIMDPPSESGVDSEADSTEIMPDDGPKTKERKKKKKSEKAKAGKLPPVPKMMHESSTTAADDVLKKFFNRR